MKDGVEAKDGGKLRLGSVPGIEPAITAADITALERSIEEANRYNEAYADAAVRAHADITFIIDTLDARSRAQSVSEAIARVRRILAAEDPVSVYG